MVTSIHWKTVRIPRLLVPSTFALHFISPACFVHASSLTSGHCPTCLLSRHFCLVLTNRIHSPCGLNLFIPLSRSPIGGSDPPKISHVCRAPPRSLFVESKIINSVLILPAISRSFRPLPLDQPKTRKKKSPTINFRPDLFGSSCAQDPARSRRPDDGG